MQYTYIVSEAEKVVEGHVCQIHIAGDGGSQQGLTLGRVLSLARGHLPAKTGTVNAIY